MGAVLSDAAAHGAAASVICFTHGEASTLSLPAGGLGRVRGEELRQAAAVLGIGEPVLLDYPDGGLGDAPLEELADHVEKAASVVGARTLLAFDLGGVTGHPDHHRATEAALRAAERLDLAVMGWAVPDDVAATLNAELGTAFLGRHREEAAAVLDVDRRLQERAIACHRSQSADNPVLWRRLGLHGRREYLVWLRRPPTDVHRRSTGP